MFPWLTGFLTSKAVPEIKHAFWRTVSVVCVLAVVAFLVLGVKRILYPRATNTQTGGVSYTVHVGFGGCARLPVVKDK